MSEVQHVADPAHAFVVIGNCNESEGTLEQLAGLSVDRADDLPEGVVSWEVRGAMYAVFTCTLPTLGETHARIDST